MFHLIFIGVILYQISGIWCDPSVKFDCAMWIHYPSLLNESRFTQPANLIKPILKRKYYNDVDFSIWENVDAILEDSIRMLLVWNLVEGGTENSEEDIAIIKHAICGSKSDYDNEVREKFEEVCDTRENDNSITDYKFCFGVDEVMVGFWDKSSMTAVNKLFENLDVDSDELMDIKEEYFCRTNGKDVKLKTSTHCHSKSGGIESRVIEDPYLYEDKTADYIKRKIAGDYIKIPKYLKNTKADQAVTKVACVLGVQKEYLFKYYMKTYCEKTKNFWQFF